jgi:hypothetical protein
VAPLPEFDLKDRARTDAYLARLIARWKQATGEVNPLLKKEKMSALQKELDDLNTRLKGKKVEWQFKTALISRPLGLQIVPPSTLPFNVTGYSYIVSSGSDTIPNVRRGVLGGVTKPLVPPRLLVDRDITREAYRKLRGGEVVTVTGTIQEIKYELTVIGLIDVYVNGAKILLNPGNP